MTALLSSVMAKIDAMPSPENSSARDQWTPIYPAYLALRKKGFSMQGAVDWMAREGLIPAGKEGKALKAFQCHATRLNKKSRP